MESDLVNHVLQLESRLFGVTCLNIRKLAFQIAEANGVEYSFNMAGQIAGKDWLEGFRRRHPQLAIRKPEATSLARTQAYNKPQVSRFSNTQLSHTTLTRWEYTTWTSLDSQQCSPLRKLLPWRGKQRVGANTSAERGVHCTVVCCMSSAGTLIPPAVIFPRKRWKQELGDNWPTGTLNMCQ